MYENEKLEAVLDGYVVMAQDLLADWVPFVEGLSGKVTSAESAPEAAAAAFPGFAKLVADSMFRVFAEAGDALAIITSSFDQRLEVVVMVDPDITFTGEVTLLIKGDFTCDWPGSTVLHKERVSVVPDRLVPTDTQYVLKVDGTGLDPRIYDGVVVYSDLEGKVVGEQCVSVAVA